MFKYDANHSVGMTSRRNRSMIVRQTATGERLRVARTAIDRALAHHTSYRCDFAVNSRINNGDRFRNRRSARSLALVS
ncbi:hypothetical protein A8926_4534 [Saccharopolyspora spinosa]|uniref:Uncharacterized protein n=1 Tax=Saccharopolyspora spinosa TaxID=60894 RepID=A0A2N3Y184_SACSN|nr:hypothetical protein A8926_4534 [Saccharopolyspora spinosa]